MTSDSIVVNREELGAARCEPLEDFDAVMRQHQKRIFRLLFGWVRDEELADALTQECFLRAFRHRQSFRGEASVATWLTRIALHLAQDHSRSRRQGFWRRLFQGDLGGEKINDLHDRQAISADRQMAARQDLDRVWQVVEGLPVRQRTVFQLRFAEDMALADIAEVMGLRTGTVKTHLFRAVHTVRLVCHAAEEES